MAPPTVGRIFLTLICALQRATLSRLHKMGSQRLSYGTDPSVFADSRQVVHEHLRVLPEMFRPATPQNPPGS